MVERALLVGAYTETNARTEASSLLAELEELVDTLGIPIVDRMLVYHREQHARFLIGSGKAEEITKLVKERNLDVIVFDNELSPSQQRNWEKLSGVTVIDSAWSFSIFSRGGRRRARPGCRWNSPKWNTRCRD